MSTSSLLPTPSTSAHSNPLGSLAHSLASSPMKEARILHQLQRAVLNGLEDLKAKDIAVFHTEKASSLFERVIVATATSNRQTRALSKAISDNVIKAGFPKPRLEGEENGEWVIVDCGAVVVHVMQAQIRDYYALEELWGTRPLRLHRPSLAAKTTATLDHEQ
jgi:ribosome-associated protein